MRLCIGVAEACPAPAKAGARDGRGVSRLDVSLRAAYLDAVAQGGHVPVLLPRFAPEGDFGALLDRIDILMLAGGPDISPERYGARPDAAARRAAAPGGSLNLVRDRFELALVAAARRRSMPIVGICRGCQMLNVAFGGTLWQDIPGGLAAKHRKSRHRIAIDESSMLYKMVLSAKPLVNSSHHQSVREIPLGFRPVAFAPDGTVEAIESECFKALGVQFHPERLVSFGHNALWRGFFSRLSALL